MHDPTGAFVEGGAVALFSLLAGGHVLDHADEVERLARRVARQRHRAVGPDGPAILAYVAPLLRKRVELARQHALPVPHAIDASSGWENSEPFLPMSSSAG
jgi:hypothetical protein